MNEHTADIIPAIIPQSFEELQADAERARMFGANWVQIDITDGDFTSHSSWPCTGTSQWEELEALARGEKPLPQGLSYEAHLMVAEPHYLGDLLARGGVSRIIAHTEGLPDKTLAREAFGDWRRSGATEVGIALLIDTPISAIESYLDHSDVDSVLVMAIAEIGAQGHAFDERAILRVAQLHAAYPQLPIAVDGGVTTEHAAALIAAGASRLAVGSFIWQSPDPATAFSELSALQGT